MDKKSKGKNQRLLAWIFNWWKRKRGFYLVQNDSNEEAAAEKTFSSANEDDERKEEEYESWDQFPVFPESAAPIKMLAAPVPFTPTETLGPRTPDRNKNKTIRANVSSTDGSIDRGQLPGSPRRYPCVRDRDADSYQGSLESMDSLTDSYWDPGDNESEATPVANNNTIQADFLDEHVDFLKGNTQPREVQVVWASPFSKNKEPFYW
jgi:hypothetical protein